MPYIKIETLSPVHIGSGTEWMGNYEYLKFSNERKIVVIDDHKVLNLIGKENLNRWVSLIENQGDLLEYLQRQKSDLVSADVARYSMHAPGVTPSKENTIKAFIRNGQHMPYIPGSSLKGAMRTAFLRMLIDQQPAFVKQINNLQDRYGKFKDQQLVKNYLVNTNERGKEPNHDAFRFLRITDASFRETHCLKAQTLNEKQEEKLEVKHPVSQFVEALPAGSLGLARLTIPKKYLQEYDLRHKLPKKLKESFEEEKLFEIINAHTQQLLEKEIESWEELYLPKGSENFVSQLKSIREQITNLSSGTCIMRMGHGSGFLFMTGGWQKEYLEGENYDKLDDAIRGKRNGNPYSTFPLPKSRRFVEEGTPMGFVKLTLLSDHEVDEVKQKIATQPTITSKPSASSSEKKQDAVTADQERSTPKKPTEPEYFKGKLKAGAGPVAAVVKKPGKPNKVRLYIEGYEEKLIDMTGYNGPLKEGDRVDVKLNQVIKKKGIIQVGFLKLIQ